VGAVPVPELVLRHLLPLAHSGLEEMGVDVEVRDRLLGIIEQRCITGRNGASWLIDDFEHRLKASSGDRLSAMRATTRRYQELMHRNEPVHGWPTGGTDD
jgi:hypothetical protein